MKAEKQTRVTKKSRILELISGTIQEYVLGSPGTFNCCPSIDQIAEQIVDEALPDDASNVVRTMLLDEMTNEVTRYWREACLQAAQDMARGSDGRTEPVSGATALPFHMLSAAYYNRKKYRTPETEEEAAQYIAMFANGRGRHVVGVRFLMENDNAEDDLMYRAYIRRTASVQVGRNQAYLDHVNDAVAAKVLSKDEAKRERHTLQQSVKRKLPFN